MLDFNLQFFAEGGEGGDGAGSPFAQDNAENIHYGKTMDDGEVASTEDEAEAESQERMSFEDLIKGDYKKDFDNKVKSIIDKRFKDDGEKQKRFDDQEKSLKEYGKLAEFLSQKYGSDPKDLKALTKAIMDDDSFYEAEAMEKGISVAEVKNIRKLERENKALAEEIEERNRIAGLEAEQRRIDSEFQAIFKQGEELKQIYPSFDLNMEMQNEQFVRLLKSGINVQTAFEVIHRNELQPRAMEYVAKQTKEAAAKSIASGTKRPSENMAKSSATFTTKTDPKSFTDKDWENIRERVRRGEKIYF